MGVPRRSWRNSRISLALSMANSRSRGTGRVEEAGTVRSPSEVIKIRQLTCVFPASLQGRSTAESGVNAPLVVIGSELIQLAMQIEAVPEEGVVEILAPKRSDQPLDEWMRARREGDGFEFLDVENSQIRAPAMKLE